MARRRKVNSRLKSILNTSIYLLLVLLFAFLMVNYVIVRATVIGQSMENTLYDGDQMFMEKISYKFTDVKRFDMIVFPQRGKSNTCLIKRVIALPGESVRIDKDGNIYINEELLEENYGKEVIKNPGNAKSTIWLGNDEYFVLGDNRNDSIDSRFDEVGIVKERSIKGRVFYRLMPFDKMGFVK